MKKSLLVSLLFCVFICVSWAADKKTTTSSKSSATSEDYLIRSAVKNYLCAIRDLDATKC